LDRCPVCLFCLSVLSVCSVCDVSVLQPNGWMDQDATWYGGRPQPRPHCVRWGLSSSLKRDTAAPSLWPMSVVAKWSPISATAEVLYIYNRPLTDINVTASIHVFNFPIKFVIFTVLISGFYN